MKKQFIIRNVSALAAFIGGAKQWTLEHPVSVTVSHYKPTRSLEQNAKMWAMLGDIAKQVEWHGRKLTPENWKDMATAALRGQDAVPGIEGGFVVLGRRTSKMSTSDMSELIEFLYAFGGEHEVEWTEEEYAENTLSP